MKPTPETRITVAGAAEVNASGDFVLLWMVAHRRTEWNFSLQRAVEWALELKKPLVVLEALRVGYQWASDRIHYFVIQGMADNAKRLERKPALYYPYVEPELGDGRGLLAELAKRACVVVSDDFPCFFLPRMQQSAARQIPVRFEQVDSNGLFPMRAAEKVFLRAVDFRRFLQKSLRPHLDELPMADPFAGVRLPRIEVESLPPAITGRWPVTDVAALSRNPAMMDRFPIDHGVSIAPDPGGARAAQRRLRDFVTTKLADYESRNDPERGVSSGLSPYLHFGHLSAHQIFSEAVASDGWSPNRIAEKATGSSAGWWGANAAVESFLDELVTWRELGYNMCWQRDDYDQYESLPNWAQQTLAQHEGDPRPHTYTAEQFEACDTHDELWNAAHRQLVREGRIHNYLRMLWGKKILEWTPTPRSALEMMIELNNKFALDGRNPNSYSGIFWVLGRYDRAWGPERPIFGKVRYMSSANTARKLSVKGYLQQYGA